MMRIGIIGMGYVGLSTAVVLDTIEARCKNGAQNER